MGDTLAINLNYLNEINRPAQIYNIYMVNSVLKRKVPTRIKCTGRKLSGFLIIPKDYLPISETCSGITL